MSFVNIKEYNKLKAKVGELEARLQALETHGVAVYSADQPEPEPEQEQPIQSIEEAVEEKSAYPPLSDLLDEAVVSKLYHMDYMSVEDVNAASDEDLRKISGIGQATVDKIRQALE